MSRALELARALEAEVLDDSALTSFIEVLARREALLDELVRLDARASTAEERADAAAVLARVRARDEELLARATRRLDAVAAELAELSRAAHAARGYRAGGR